MKFIPLTLSALLFATVFISDTSAQDSTKIEMMKRYEEFVEVRAKTEPMHEDSYRRLKKAVENEGMSMTRYEMLITAKKNNQLTAVDPSIDERQTLERLEATSEELKSRMDKQLDILLENSHLSRAQYDAINEAYESNEETRSTIDQLISE